MGASRRLRRQIKRRGQREENRVLTAQVAMLTEALEVADAVPIYTDEHSPQEAWEAAGFTPVEAGLADLTEDELRAELEDELVSPEDVDRIIDGEEDISPAQAAFRRILAQSD